MQHVEAQRVATQIPDLQSPSELQVASALPASDGSAQMLTTDVPASVEPETQRDSPSWMQDAFEQQLAVQKASAPP
ncbi:MAG: hypothetical protein EOP08_16405 [Proteobacteria bacterium]|nr:MAG: hypothetical protein EOP08_16405 [Pseudomonadota bacterium]